MGGRPWSRRDFLRAASAGGLALAGLGSCSPAPSRVTKSAPVRGGRVVEAGGYRSLNPIRDGDTGSLAVSHLLFEGLLTSSGLQDPVPALARAHPAVSGDGLSYSFELRSEATWTDGRPVTAADVVFTYRLMYDPRYSEFPSTRRSDLEEYLKQVVALGDQLVRFDLHRPYAPFLVNFCQYGILPAHVLGQMTARELATADFNQRPNVSNGQFRFVRADPEGVELARNERYHRGPPLLAGLVIRNLAAQDLPIQLRTGEVDVGQVPAASYDSLRGEAGLDTVLLEPVAWTAYLMQLDPARPGSRALGDRAVRRALLHALDRERLARAVYFGLATVADSVLVPSSWAHVTPAQRYPFDPRQAGLLLDVGGWRRGEDGRRSKAGLPLAFELQVAGGGPGYALAQAAQEQWRALGITVSLRQVAGPVLIDNLISKRDFEAMYQGFPSSSDPDPSRIFHSRAAVKGGLNGMAYLSPELDRLLDEAVGVIDRERRRALYRRIQEKLAEDLPVLPLLYPTPVEVRNRRVRNWRQAAPVVSTRPWMKDVYVTDGR